MTMPGSSRANAVVPACIMVNTSRLTTFLRRAPPIGESHHGLWLER